jgi:hypothetical protein
VEDIVSDASGRDLQELWADETFVPVDAHTWADLIRARNALFEKRSTPVTKRLVLTIDFPGFYVEGDESDEDVEESMHLASEDVIVVFSGHEGDSPGSVLRSLEGRIRKFEVVS